MTLSSRILSIVLISIRDKILSTIDHSSFSSLCIGMKQSTDSFVDNDTFQHEGLSDDLTLSFYSTEEVNQSRDKVDLLKINNQSDLFKCRRRRRD